MSSLFNSHMFEAKYSINVWRAFLFVDVALLICVVSLLLKYVWQRRVYNRILPSKRLPFFDILGHLSEMPKTSKSRNGWSRNTLYLQLLSGHSKLFKDKKLFAIWISYAPFVWLKKAEAVEAFITGTKNNEKSWSYNMLHPWLGTGLLTSHGKKWKSRRKLLTPAFHLEILRDFLPVINEQSQVLVKRLQKETSKEYTDIENLLAYCSLDVICETTLGVSIRAQENNDSQYVKSVQNLTEILMERMINCFAWLDIIFSRTERGKQFNYHLHVVQEFTRSVIREKKKQLLMGDPDRKTRKRRALLDLLLEHHIHTKQLSEEDIREEVETFAFAGHDTTSVGMSWALYLIGLYKDVQAKLHEELDSIFGIDIDREINNDDINRMKYLHCVLKESKRLYPSVPFIGRNISEDTEICGYKLPKGGTCIIMVHELHRDEDVFPDPEKFDPDRFLSKNSIGRHPFAYIPFSAGPRNCIGQRLAMMEEKVVVADILRNYSIHSLDERDKVLPAPDIVLKPAKTLRIKFSPRN